MLTGGRLKLTNGYEIAYTNRYNNWITKEGFVVLDSEGHQVGGLYHHAADALEDALKYED
jgi:hypothetical protein